MVQGCSGNIPTKYGPKYGTIPPIEVPEMTIETCWFTAFTKVWPKQKNYHVVEKLLVSPSSSNWLPIEGIRILQAPNRALIAYAHACCHGYLTNHYPQRLDGS